MHPDITTRPSWLRWLGVTSVMAALAAPTVTVATARLDRRVMLCALMLVLAFANFLAALAPTFGLMVVSRVLVGVVIGAFWSIGSGLATRLVPSENISRATAVIFSAVPLGSVLGVPTGAFIADVAGWRSAFVVMGAGTVAVFVALVAFVPGLPAAGATRLAVLRDVTRADGVRVGIVATVLIVVAHFGTYTYVTPFLAEVTQVGPAAVTILLLVYGAAGFVGNFVAAGLAARNVRATFTGAAALIAAVTLALPVAGSSGVAVAALLVIWGAAYGAVPVCSQTWFISRAPHATEAATVLFTSTFQVSISVGALFGGAVLDATSPSALMMVGGAVAASMAIIVRIAAG